MTLKQVSYLNTVNNDTHKTIIFEHFFYIKLLILTLLKASSLIFFLINDTPRSVIFDAFAIKNNNYILLLK